jgi:xanthine dehydrogenase YagR molybdenum-binding subunit
VRTRYPVLSRAIVAGAPGVVLVMTHRNAPRMKPAPVFLTAAKAAGADDLPIMQDDLIHWNGQPIAVVLAETQEQADHAKSLIRATYEAEPAVTDFDKAKALPLQPCVFSGQPLKTEINDAEAALASAPYKVDETYMTPQPQRHRAARRDPRRSTLTFSTASIGRRRESSE